MTVRGVIFDMDGLMFDSERLGMDMMSVVGKEFGVDILEEHVLEVIGTNRKNVEKRFRERYGATFPFEEFMTTKIQRVMNHYETSGVPKKEGLDVLLHYLTENHIPMVVATSTYREIATHILHKAEVLPSFKGIVCGDEVVNSKPDPEIFLKACQMLDLSPEECIVLEDSENGLRAAHDAGIRSIFIKDLVSPVEEVLQHVHHQGKTLHDVIAYIEKENKQ